MWSEKAKWRIGVVLLMIAWCASGGTIDVEPILAPTNNNGTGIGHDSGDRQDSGATGGTDGNRGDKTEMHERITSICRGNMTTCFSGMTCKHYLDPKANCLACDCKSHTLFDMTYTDQFDEVKNTTYDGYKIEVGCYHRDGEYNLDEEKAYICLLVRLLTVVVDATVEVSTAGDNDLVFVPAVLNPRQQNVLVDPRFETLFTKTSMAIGNPIDQISDDAAILLSIYFSNGQANCDKGVFVGNLTNVNSYSFHADDIDECLTTMKHVPTLILINPPEDLDFENFKEEVEYYIEPGDYMGNNCKHWIREIIFNHFDFNIAVEYMHMQPDMSEPVMNLLESTALTHAEGEEYPENINMSRPNHDMPISYIDWNSGSPNEHAIRTILRVLKSVKEIKKLSEKPLCKYISPLTDNYDFEAYESFFHKYQEFIGEWLEGEGMEHFDHISLDELKEKLEGSDDGECGHIYRYIHQEVTSRCYQDNDYFMGDYNGGGFFGKNDMWRNWMRYFVVHKPYIVNLTQPFKINEIKLMLNNGTPVFLTGKISLPPGKVDCALVNQTLNRMESKHCFPDVIKKKVVSSFFGWHWFDMCNVTFEARKNEGETCDGNFELPNLQESKITQFFLYLNQNSSMATWKPGSMRHQNLKMTAICSFSLHSCLKGCPSSIVFYEGNNCMSCNCGVCPTGKVLSQCASTCRRTCDNLQCANISCSEQARCACPDGFVEESEESHKCIPITSCGADKTCDGDLVLLQCASSCPSICGKMNESTVCTEVCVKNKCACPPNSHRLSETSNKCVKHCPLPPDHKEGDGSRQIARSHLIENDVDEIHKSHMEFQYLSMLNDCVFSMVTNMFNVDIEDEKEKQSVYENLVEIIERIKVVSEAKQSYCWNKLQDFNRDQIIENVQSYKTGSNVNLFDVLEDIMFYKNKFLAKLFKYIPVVSEAALKSVCFEDIEGVFEEKIGFVKEKCAGGLWFNGIKDLVKMIELDGTQFGIPYGNFWMEIGINISATFHGKTPQFIFNPKKINWEKINNMGYDFPIFLPVSLRGRVFQYFRKMVFNVTTDIKYFTNPDNVPKEYIYYPFLSHYRRCPVISQPTRLKFNGSRIKHLLTLGPTKSFCRWMPNQQTVDSIGFLLINPKSDLNLTKIRESFENLMWGGMKTGKHEGKGEGGSHEGGSGGSGENPISEEIDESTSTLNGGEDTENEPSNEENPETEGPGSKEPADENDSENSNDDTSNHTESPSFDENEPGSKDPTDEENSHNLDDESSNVGDEDIVIEVDGIKEIAIEKFIKNFVENPMVEELEKLILEFEPDFVKLFSILYKKTKTGRTFTLAENRLIIPIKGQITILPVTNNEIQDKDSISVTVIVGTFESHVTIKKVVRLEPISIQPGTKYEFPAIPYDLTLYEGAKVEHIIQKILSEKNKKEWKNYIEKGKLYHVGIIISSASNNEFGDWQVKCKACTTFENIFNEMEEEKEWKCGPINAENVVFLPSTSMVKFAPKTAATFWTKRDAILAMSFKIHLFRIHANILHGVAQLFDIPEVDAGTDLVTFIENSGALFPKLQSAICNIKPELIRELVSRRKLLLFVERAGCDNVPSSMNTVINACGICEEDNEACKDCNGDIDGTAKLDECGVCYGGNTGIEEASVKDCGGKCTNDEESYFMDNCDVCQQSGRPITSVRCDGTCYKDEGFAKPKCDGWCILGNNIVVEDVKYEETPDPTMKPDACGKCGGSSPTCDEAVNVIEQIIPSVLILKLEDRERRDAASNSLTLTGRFDDFNTVKCRLKSKYDQIIDLESEFTTIRNKGKAVKLTLLDMAEELKDSKVMFWKIICEFKSEESDSTELMTRLENSFNVDSFTPESLPVGTEANVTFDLSNKISDFYDLYCTTDGRIFKSWKSKIYTVKALKISEKMINCNFPSAVKASGFKVFLMTGYEAKMISKSLLKMQKYDAELFYSIPTPEVESAILDSNLNLIQLKINSDFKINNKFKENVCDIFEENNLIGHEPHCVASNKRKIIFVKPKFDVKATEAIEGIKIGELSIKEGSIQNLVNQPNNNVFQKTTVPLHLPKEITPIKIDLSSRKAYEPCDQVVLKQGLSHDILWWDVTYTWKVFAQNKEEETDTNLQNEILNELNSMEAPLKTKIVLKSIQTKLLGGYKITIQVKVSVGELDLESENSEVAFQIQQEYSPISIEARTRSSSVNSNQDIAITSEVNIVPSKCTDEQKTSDISFNDIALQYIWEVYKGDNIYSLDNVNVNEKNLKIKSGVLESGYKYKFVVTVVRWDGETKTGTAEAEKTIEILSSPLVVRFKQDKMTTVSTEDDLVIDATKSYDPDNSEDIEEIEWICRVDEDELCEVQTEEDGPFKNADIVFKEFLQDKIEKKFLQIPGSYFKTDNPYTITMTIKKGDRVASNFINIVFKSDEYELPKIKAKLKTKKIAHTKSLIIDSSIKGTARKWNSIAQWTMMKDEEEVIEMSRKEITLGNSRINFPLQIEADTLSPGSKYLFQLIVAPNLDLESSIDIADIDQYTVTSAVEVDMPPIPFGGKLQITPDKGTIKDTFLITANEWEIFDTADALQYKFSYIKDTTTKRKQILSSFQFDKEIEVHLPAGLLTITVEIRSLQYGTIAKASKTIEITDVILNEQEKEDLKEEINEAIVGGNPTDALLKLTTLSNTGDDEEVKNTYMENIIASIAEKEINSNEESTEQLNMLSSILNLSNNLSNGTIEEGSTMLGNVLEFYKSDTEDSSSRRKKRATVEDESFDIEFTPETAQLWLDIYDKLFASIDDTFSINLILSVENGFAEIEDFIKSSFCLSMLYDDIIMTNSENLMITVKKPSVPANIVSAFKISADDKTNVIYTNTYIEQFYSWDCNEDMANCNGICNTLGEYGHAAVLGSRIADTIDSGKRISSIASLGSQNPETGLFRPETEPFKTTITFNDLKKIDLIDELNVECRQLGVFTWSSENCETVVSDESVTAFDVDCACNYAQGHFSVFSVLKEESSSTAPPDMCPEGLVIAETCTYPCIGYCSKTNTSNCKTPCTAGTSCICPPGTILVQGACVDEDQVCSPSHSKHTGTIVGGVMGGLAGILCIALIIKWLCSKQSTSMRTKRITPESSIEDLKTAASYESAPSAPIEVEDKPPAYEVVYDNHVYENEKK